MPFLVIFIIAVYLFLCIKLIGNLAESRGREKTGWILLAVFIDPILAMILLYALPNAALENKRLYEMESQQQEYKHEIDELKSKLEASKTKDSHVTSADLLQSMSKIYGLYKNELISEDDYLNKKAALIEKLNGQTIDEPIDDFLAALLPLIENGMLSKDDIQNIKCNLAYDSKYEEEKSRLSQIETRNLIDKYLKTHDKLAEKELINRNVDITNMEQLRLSLFDDKYLLRQYIFNGSPLVEKELKNRNLSTDKEDIIACFNNIDLIDLYKETKSDLSRKELVRRSLNEYL